jgi:hypothetical protein
VVKEGGDIGVAEVGHQCLAQHMVVALVRIYRIDRWSGVALHITAAVDLSA